MPSCPPLPSPFSNQRDGGPGRRDGGATLRFCIGVVHPSAFLVWMKTSAGRCSRGTTWVGQVGRARINPDRENITNLYLKFPGILNKCFFKPGNLTEESSPVTQTTKKMGQIV